MGVSIRKRAPSPADGVGIGSVRTFLDHMESIPRDIESILYFRGHPNFLFELQPSIYRNPGWISNESILFRELILRCPSEFEAGKSTFELLVRMQHYSLPTRLLDITANPLVALYFACQEREKYLEDGEVIVLRIPKPQIKYFDSDTVSVIANISRRPGGFAVPPSSDIKTFNSTPEIRYLLHEIKAEKPYFEPLIQREHLGQVICVKPKLSNARIIRQDGAFLLFGVNGIKMLPAAIPGAYRPAGPRIIVKRSDKKRLLSQLAALSITEGTLFPEIERVAGHIKETYFQRSDLSPSSD